ncbi:hypothetical protein K502DRAFT_113799 [Neoconidiobolus thromboides FSU 785]|nr:hypothetical protein K502DRAFT_113799 [Neoconidiobolus thromboides FSU 785]
MNPYHLPSQFELSEEDLLTQQEAFLKGDKENSVQLKKSEKEDKPEQKSETSKEPIRISIGDVLSRDQVQFGHIECDKENKTSKKKTKSLFALRRELERNGEKKGEDSKGAPLSTDGLVLKGVKEREITQPKVIEFTKKGSILKKNINTSGFPRILQHKERNEIEEIKKKDEIQKKDFKLGSIADSEDIMDEISKENEKKLEEMSEKEIIRLRQELLLSLDPKLIEVLTKDKGIIKEQEEANASGGSVKEIENEGESKEKVEKKMEKKVMFQLTQKEKEKMENPHLEAIEKNISIEQDKLKWMDEIPDSDNNDKPKEKQNQLLRLRFNFQGDIVNSKQDIPTHHGLHHHGKSPELAGYSLEELMMYLNSSYIYQKTLSISIIKKILWNIIERQIELEEDKENILEYFVKNRLGYGLLLNLKGRNLTLIYHTIDLLHTWLIGISNQHEFLENCIGINYSELFKFDLSEILIDEEKDTEMLRLETYDTVNSLIWHGILNEIYKLIQRNKGMEIKVRNQLLELLILFVSYSNEFGQLMVNMQGFIDTLNQHIIVEMKWPPSNKEIKEYQRYCGIKLYIKLIRLLCQSDPQIAIKLEMRLQPLIKYLLIEVEGNEWTQLKNDINEEIFKLAKQLLYYNIYWLKIKELFNEVYMKLVKQLNNNNKENSSNDNRVLISFYNYLHCYTVQHLIQLDKSELSLIYSFFRELFYQTLKNIKNVQDFRLLAAILDFLSSQFQLVNQHQLFNNKDVSMFYQQVEDKLGFEKIMKLLDCNTSIENIFLLMKRDNMKFIRLFPAIGINNLNQFNNQFQQLNSLFLVIRAYLSFDLKEDYVEEIYKFVINLLNQFNNNYDCFYLFTSLQHILLKLILLNNNKYENKNLVYATLLIQYSKDIECNRLAMKYCNKLFKQRLINNTQQKEEKIERFLNKLTNYWLKDINSTMLLNFNNKDNDFNVLWLLKPLTEYWPVQIEKKKTFENEDVLLLFYLIEYYYLNFKDNQLVCYDAKLNQFHFLKLIYLPQHFGLNEELNLILNKILIIIQPYLNNNNNNQQQHRYNEEKEKILNLRYQLLQDTIPIYLDECFFNLNYLYILIHCLTINDLFTVDFQILILQKLIPKMPTNIINQLNINNKELSIYMEYEVIDLVTKLFFYLPVTPEIPLLYNLMKQTIIEYFEINQQLESEKRNMTIKEIQLFNNIKKEMSKYNLEEKNSFFL